MLDRPGRDPLTRRKPIRPGAVEGPTGRGAGEEGAARLRQEAIATVREFLSGFRGSG